MAFFHFSPWLGDTLCGFATVGKQSALQSWRWNAGAIGAGERYKMGLISDHLDKGTFR